MSNTQRTEIDTLLSHIEELWADLDALFERMTPADWQRPHGKDWIFADLPWHMMYFDRDIIAAPLEYLENLPPERQLLLTPANLDEWNARMLAARPPSQTVDQSLAEMRAERERIRRAVAPLVDADLGRRAWGTFFVGWQTVRAVLATARAHCWSEFVQLRILMGLAEPVPSAAATHAVFADFLGAFQVALNRDLAARQRLTVVMEFTQPGVGPWTLSVADGALTVSEGRAPQPDLVITQSPETFLTDFRGKDPSAAIQRGDIKISDFAALATFGQLFAPPPADASPAT